MKEAYKNENWQTRHRAFHLLAKRWICTHRPDVAKVIQEEVDKQYPLKRVSNSRIRLPKSLAEMK